MFSFKEITKFEGSEGLSWVPDPDLKRKNRGFTGDASKRKVLFSETLMQNRLLDDFNFLLGSNDMPCSEEKNLCSWLGSSCFGTVDLHSVDNNNIMQEANKIRNRAGESWRARAYRIRRLREERMISAAGWVVIED